ncbi:MAG: hypothetical protein U9R32_05345 [Bacteroidota bacterium]|nr:hypothetical protein [Bacteroidota bacterium]
MKSKTIPLSFARCLLRLIHDEHLNASDFASKGILKQFMEDGIIQKIPAGSRRLRYLCNKKDTLRNYLKNQYGIISIEDFILLSDKNSVDGQDSLLATNSTKTFRTKSLQGFFIKPLNVEIKISGESLPLLPGGTEIFIHEPKKLTLPSSTLIVGVENPECFVKIEKLLHLFPQKELLFVMRYMSLSPINWLKNIPNSYLHFGDFDPAGISIYINEFYNKLGVKRCDFYTPNNIEYLIKKYGNEENYNKQKHQLKNINSSDYPSLKSILDIMNSTGKGMEQERLLLLKF